MYCFGELARDREKAIGDPARAMLSITITVIKFYFADF
jgi:hypothetical protein